MRGIAFYGKGGIGKSTTISNVIAALSSRRQKILQIGCDPKHDSTRLLLGGFTQTTVLEQLTTNGSVSLDAVMLTGYNGVKCIESGGPEPGVGCAGRGIIQTLQLLRDQGLDTSQFDYVFFDVLGDVVCGGFAVPMREGYADEVYIVTSGEIASLYAANNIAKGLKRFSTTRGKLGGIIGNERGTKNELEVIEQFAKKIGTKMVAFIPRSDLIQQAELDSKTIMEFAPGTQLAEVYLTIADYIEHNKNPVIPTPLSESELESFLHEYCYDKRITERKNTAPSNAPAKATLQQPTPMNTTACNSSNQTVNTDREPVHGCSLSGAFNVISQIKDAVALMYSPQGCSYLSFCTHIHRFPGSDSQYIPNLLCTNMNETDVIFGGTKTLEETLLSLQKKFPAYPIFLITSCPAGIIGDDVDAVISRLTTEKQKIIPIPSDGVLGGDFYAGMFKAYQTVAEQFIDESVNPEEDTVNLIGEQNLSTTANQNYNAISQILSAIEVKVNCRFIRQTNLKEIKNFKKARINIPMINQSTINALTDYLDTRFDTKTINPPIPVAFNQTAEFARAVAQCFSKEAAAEQLIKRAKTAYELEMAPLRAYFAGKKASIYNSYGCNIDWLLSTLADLDVELFKISSVDLSYTTERAIPFKPQTYTSTTELQDTKQLDQMDFILTNGPAHFETEVPCEAFPILPLYGFNSGLTYVKQLCIKLKIPFIERWRKDEKLFNSFT